MINKEIIAKYKLIISQKYEHFHCAVSAISDLNPPPARQNQKV